MHKSIEPMNLINQLTMSSREIAELTGKQHSHVLRDIRHMIYQLYEVNPDVDGIDLKGIFSEKRELNGQIAAYHLDRYHSEILVTGYDIKRRAAVIKRWYDLETAKPKLPDFSDPVAAARAWADEAEQKQIAQQALAIAAPKADFYDAVTGSDDCIDMAAAAKTLAIKGMGRTKLFKLLRDKKVLQKNNQPYQEQVDAGRFRVIETKWTDGNGDTHINLKTVVYQKGLDYIRKLIEKAEACE